MASPVRQTWCICRVGRGTTMTLRGWQCCPKLSLYTNFVHALPAIASVSMHHLLFSMQCLSFSLPSHRLWCTMRTARGKKATFTQALAGVVSSSHTRRHALPSAPAHCFCCCTLLPYLVLPLTTKNGASLITSNHHHHDPHWWYVSSHNTARTAICSGALLLLLHQPYLALTPLTTTNNQQPHAHHHHRQQPRCASPLSFQTRTSVTFW
jgi:hypothetical protein